MIKKLALPISILLIAAAFLACGYIIFRRAEVNKSRRNVVLITIDTQRADYIGCYGERAAKTPTIDSIAAAGLMFKHAYSVAFGTTPSHSSIMTSTYARQHGVYSNFMPLSRNSLTIAEILKARGFNTAAFVSALPVHSRLGLNQGFDLYNQWFDPAQDKIERNAKQATDATLIWLNSTYKENSSPAPLFMWVHYYDVHKPYNPPPEFRNIFFDTDKLLPASLASSEPERIKALYAGETSFVDQQLGRITEWFTQKGLDRNTMFIILADHGETLDEPGRGEFFDHNTVYDEVVRVPLIVKAPGRQDAGTVIGTPVTTLDVLPTVMDFLGMQPPAGAPIKGVSLFTIPAKAPSVADEQPLFFETAYRMGAGVRLGQYKYIRYYGKTDPHAKVVPKEKEQLFFLGHDPLEQHNLIDAGLPIADKMRALLDEWMKSTQNLAGPIQPQDIPDEEFRRKLHQLGYL